MRNIFKNLMSPRAKSFGRALGRRARRYILTAEKLTVGVTDFGAAITDIIVPGRDGKPVNAVLGYDDASGYEKGTSSLGATVGRYAGRIGGARFTLEGREYLLEKNDGENHLHGSFGKRFFKAERIENGVRFTLLSPDTDEGFPGELRLFVTYEAEGGTLRVTYEAETDRDTVLNITNHSYFNLSGEGNCADHVLTVFADGTAEVGNGLIPTGRLLPVHGTPLDFTAPRRLKETIEDAELSATRGLDHSFIVRGEPGTLRSAARLTSPKTGVSLLCRTTQPTVHVYTAGFLDMDAAQRLRGGAKAEKNGGVCLETQHLPDSPNRPEFPSVLLKAGERFREVTEYVFGTEG